MVYFCSYKNKTWFPTVWLGFHLFVELKIMQNSELNIKRVEIEGK